MLLVLSILRANFVEIEIQSDKLGNKLPQNMTVIVNTFDVKMYRNSTNFQICLNG